MSRSRTQHPLPSEPASRLLDRLHSQFPELSRDEVLHAAGGVAALPADEPAEPAPVLITPPRHRA